MLPQSWTHQADYEASVRAPAVAPEQPTPFWSAVGNAARTSAVDQFRTRQMGVREFQWLERLSDRHVEIERLTGQKLRPSAELMRTQFPADATGNRRSALPYPSQEEYEAEIDRLRAEYPSLAALPRRADMWRAHEAVLTGIRQRADEAASKGAGGAIGSFAGGSAAAILDPVNLTAAAATGGLAAGRPLLVRMMTQGAVGAGVEIAQTPGRAADAANYGGPAYTGSEAVMDIAGGAVGGAGFELVTDAGKYVWRNVARRLGSSDEPLERGLANNIQTLMDDEDILANATDFDEARARLDRGDLPPEVPVDQELDDLFNQQALPSVAASQPEQARDLIGAEYMGRQIWSGRFDPLEVEADAARFQYKAQGDSDGVTSRLRGVERWDTTASGKALLFEDTDGRIFVADGHQRRGLARRLAEQGWEDAKLDGYLFRASDGWTDKQVRVVAALKNIREGSGTIMDAAKLFREAPQAIKDRSLPVTGDFIHQARQLASLSDAAFRAVTNGVIPERYGAVIGELAGDRPDLQADLVDLVRRAEPGTADGARSLVHEAMLDDFIANEGVQADLFGGLPRESTVIARGKIRESVMRSLRKDERTFAGLVRNADAVEAGGNILARNENEARLATDRAAQEVVSRLSLRSGDIGEAFTEAAAAVTRGEMSAADAAKGLTQRIRNAVKSGELLEMERKATLDPDPPSDAAIKLVKTFDEPAGAGQKAQLEPKPEDDRIEAYEEPSIDQRLEAATAAEAEARAVVESERTAVAQAREAVERLTQEVEANRPLADTRGQGVQYHGARGKIEALSEGYYNPDNIYGGWETFYTTDATDIASGYGRKNPNAVTYEVRETRPVSFFDMEESRTEAEWRALLGIDNDSHEFDLDVLESAVREYGETPNLRQIMDEYRALSRDYSFSKDDVQDVFSSIIYRLLDEGYDGMRHVGGLQTNKAAHEVKIYLKPHEQIEIREVQPSRADPPAEKLAELEAARAAVELHEKAVNQAQSRAEDLAGVRAELENEARPTGLFDDILNDNLPEERALNVLAQCAPGGR